MSVDFYTCDYCEGAFADCSDYISCNEDCSREWCCEECAEKEGYRLDYCKLKKEEFDDRECEEFGYCDECEHYVNASCSFCREEEFDDCELLDYTMKLLGKSRQEIIEMYKKEK